MPLPSWMNDDLITETYDLLKDRSGEDKVKILRGQNLSMQMDLPTWKLLRGKRSNSVFASTYQAQPSKEVVAALLDHLQEQTQRMMDDETDAEAALHKVLKATDPAGSCLLHQCFLLGLVSVGKSMIESHYNSPDLISIPYKSDLDPWVDAGVVTRHDMMLDEGLYTGETVLHIVIVNRQLEACRWLLDRGADITAKAIGVFFRPAVMRREQVEPDEHGRYHYSRWQRLMAWIQHRDLQQDPLAERVQNNDSACYYGEYPLSFAASVGDVEVCKMLYEEAQKRKRDKEDTRLCHFFEEVAERHTQDGISLSRWLRERQTSSPDALLACPWPDAAAEGSGSGLGGHGNGDGEEDGEITPLPSHRSLRKSQGLGSAASSAARAWQAKHPVWAADLPFDLLINVTDSQGNTPLHLAVMHQQHAIIDWLFTVGAQHSLETMNDDGFTPVTLAARLGLVATFHHTVSHMRDLVWTYGDVQMTKTSLEQIDTFRIKGKELHDMRRWRSALEVIVTHEVEGFANDELFNKLIREKWTRFGRDLYLRTTFVPYVMLLVLFSVVLSLRCEDRRTVWAAKLNGEVPFGRGPVEDPSYLWKWNELTGYTPLIATALEVALVVLWVPWLVLVGWRQRRLGPKDYDPNEDGEISAQEMMLFLYKNLTFILNIGVAICLVMAVTAGLIYTSPWDRMELQTLAVTSILLWCNFLNVIMPFKFFGVLVIIIYKMLIGDFFKFLVVFIIMVGAFSQALFALLQLSDFPDEIDNLDGDPAQTLLRLVWVSLGDVDSTQLIDQTASPQLTLAVYVVWVMLSVLLINLLIAMMGQTFESDMEDTHKTWVFPFAHRVLSYERLMSRHQLSVYRTGNPGRTDVDDEHYGDAFRTEAYYEIRVEEDRVKVERTRKRQQEKKDHRLVLKTVRALGEDIRACSETVQSLRRAIDADPPLQDSRSPAAGKHVNSTPRGAERNKDEVKPESARNGDGAGKQEDGGSGGGVSRCASLAGGQSQSQSQSEGQEQGTLPAITGLKGLAGLKSESRQRLSSSFDVNTMPQNREHGS